MNAVAFDTYTAAKHLRDAGFDERRAEAAVAMVRDAVGADREQPATKGDVDTAIAGLESRVDAKLAGLEARLYRALWIQGGAIVAILTALRFLPV